MEISAALSWGIVLMFICIQFLYFLDNLRKLNKVKHFFNKSEKYSVIGEGEKTRISAKAAASGTNLRSLIDEINQYVKRNHGTTDFSIVQDKTERKIGLLWENAVSKLSFPVYIGLMGTFCGVFTGLLFFNEGLQNSAEGITDNAITGLIYGVLVSMSTSFIGLLLTTVSNHRASIVRRVVDKDKSEFFDFIQTELMPTLGVSMVAALNKLHQTITVFEPSFTRVIDRFESTFEECTGRFGNAFEQNVTAVAEAVRMMGENMNKVNDNVALQTQLLKTLRTKGITDTLDAFVGAATHFGHVTTALKRFEEARNSIFDTTNELVDTQRRYMESLEVPKKVAQKLNAILDRVTEFEKNIKLFGRSIKETQLLGNSEIELVKEHLTAIKKKQTVAMNYIELSDGHLEDIFKLQDEAITKLNRRFEEGLAGYAERFDLMLDRLAGEMEHRRNEIVKALEEKFSIEQIGEEFSQLGKLNDIKENLDSLNRLASVEFDNEMKKTNSEIRLIHSELSKLLDEVRNKPQSLIGGFFRGRK